MYLRAYSTAQRPIINVSMSKEIKQTLTYKQKTKHGKVYYLDNNHPICAVTRAIMRWKGAYTINQSINQSIFS
jgi:hypothetical protein